jgi:hypothetical protein
MYEAEIRIAKTTESQGAPNLAVKAVLNEPHSWLLCSISDLREVTSECGYLT